MSYHYRLLTLNLVLRFGWYIKNTPRIIFSKLTLYSAIFYFIKTFEETKISKSDNLVYPLKSDE